MTPSRADAYTRITDEIAATIEAGAGNWKMPWHHDGRATSRPLNVASSRYYRGINVLLLWAAANAAGFAEGVWGTYRQWQAEGAQVRKGEHGSTVVLWKPFERGDARDDGEQEDRGRRGVYARCFTVFNAAQVDGYESEPVPQIDEATRYAHADSFVANLGIDCEFGGDRAFYSPHIDRVQMPHFRQFKDALSFYGTLLHEHGHASGARHRLNRDLTGSFGSATYAAEEICVEILSGFLLADLGLAYHPRADHAAYVASWLKALRGDPRAIFTAASKAQLAADWMHAQQPGTAELVAHAA
ncbi:MAG: zincin-like metallopeptidase domain-containing protein [Novosphingobium sp.]|nr:zincin-like metallopeptidase domain-containing protein [Novosphingobium sp.]